MWMSINSHSYDSWHSFITSRNNGSHLRNYVLLVQKRMGERVISSYWKIDVIETCKSGKWSYACVPLGFCCHDLLRLLRPTTSWMQSRQVQILFSGSSHPSSRWKAREETARRALSYRKTNFCVHSSLIHLKPLLKDGERPKGSQNHKRTQLVQWCQAYGNVNASKLEQDGG